MVAIITKIAMIALPSPQYHITISEKATEQITHNLVHINNMFLLYIRDVFRKNTGKW